jgi:hypothetical protein
MSEPLTDPADELLERLTRTTRAARAPAIDPAALEAMTRHALIAARGRRRARAAVARGVAIGAVLAAAASVAIAWVALDREPQVAGSVASLAPSEIELPTGDRITAEAGARFAVAMPEAGVRRVRLESGEALFDVAPLGSGERFEVITLGARFEVRGTVFAVRADGTRARLHVFEGRVGVVRGDRAIEIGAGEQSDTASDDATRAPWSPALRAQGEASALRRAERGGARSEPSVTRVDGVGVGDAPDVVAAARGAHAARPTPGPERTGLPANAERGPPATAERTPARRPLVEGRSALERGEPELALEIARARAPSRGEWAMLEADALRALGRHAEAADAYDRAAATSSASPATQAGYLAARIRLQQLSDPAGALRSLDASRADAPHSPIEDVALALRVRALIAARRTSEARDAARTHLARFPASASRRWMTVIADAADGE